MIGSTRALQVWAWPAPMDLRKGIDGLHGVVRNGLKRDALSGDLFLFVNRDRTRAKVLFWDGTGMCLYMKRLEIGRFARLWPLPSDAERGAKPESSTAVTLTPSELSLFLEGCELVGRTPLSPPELIIGAA